MHNLKMGDDMVNNLKLPHQHKTLVLGKGTEKDDTNEIQGKSFYEVVIRIHDRGECYGEAFVEFASEWEETLMTVEMEIDLTMKRFKGQPAYDLILHLESIAT